jgi:predicted dehydrogenase
MLIMEWIFHDEKPNMRAARRRTCGITMSIVRIGISGAGLISQVEHIPNLLHLPSLFQLVAVADPSAQARAFVAERWGLPTHESLDGLLGERLDALLVASPDFAHRDTVLSGLAAGLHVLCEKPLCYDVADADRLIAARDAAGRVLQVGYMKRFDPSVEAALAALPAAGDGLRYIAVEVNEAETAVHMSHHPFGPGGDLPADLVAAGRAEQRRQVTAAIGRPLSGMLFTGFATAYCASMIHDVNLVHLVLDRLGIPDGQVVGADLFCAGDGGLGAVRLLDGRAAWQMMHLMVPKVADYRERVAFYFDDRIIELIFPSPYLNHQQTELIIQRSVGHRFERTLVRSSYDEAYVRELVGFWSSVAGGAPVRNTAEEARRDLRLLADLARYAASHRAAA